MSYEYNAANGRFEIANPYRLENIALLICGGIGIAASLLLLFEYRGVAIEQGSSTGIRALLVGIALLLCSVVLVARALSQLRYYFGRGRPADVTNLDDAQGLSPQRRAAWLKENLRQNALIYAEPQGPISNLLHHYVDTLIFAPRQIRAAAEAQAVNALLTLALLIGVLAGTLFYRQESLGAWMALLMSAIALPTLVRPFTNAGVANRTRAGIATVVAIIVLPILAPLLLNRIASGLPDLAGLHVSRTVLICLVILLAAQLLFFAALLRQLRPRPEINMACEQRAISLNGNPAKLFEELQRVMQSQWVESIPNRAYAKQALPDVLSGQSGSFAGEVMEETQPTPVSALDRNASLGDLMNQDLTKPLLALEALGTVAFLAATWLLVQAAVTSDSVREIVSSGVLSAVLYFSAFYAFRSAHFLLGRVDFESVLIWIELNGSFEEAQVNIGNQLVTAMSSTKKVINVESMTLRVWAAELSTVILQKNGLRDLIGMRGRPDIAKFYADHLTSFAGQLTTVVAPTSGADQARLEAIAGVQRAMGGNATAALPGMPQVPTPATALQPAAGRRRYCSACGTEAAQTAAFCGSCGARL